MTQAVTLFLLPYKAHACELSDRISASPSSRDEVSCFSVSYKSALFRHSIRGEYFHDYSWPSVNSPALNALALCAHVRNDFVDAMLVNNSHALVGNTQAHVTLL